MQTTVQASINVKGNQGLVETQTSPKIMSSNNQRPAPAVTSEIKSTFTQVLTDEIKLWREHNSQLRSSLNQISGSSRHLVESQLLAQQLQFKTQLCSQLAEACSNALKKLQQSAA